MGKKPLKLTPEQQLELCGLLAAGYNAARASRYLLENYGIHISRQNILQTYVKSPKWQPIITRLIEAMDKEIMKHPLAKKVNRLNCINDAINHCFTRRNIAPVPSLVREARIEIEGESLGIKGNVTHEHFFNQIVKKAAERRKKAEAHG